MNHSKPRQNNRLEGGKLLAVVAISVVLHLLGIVVLKDMELVVYANGRGVLENQIRPGSDEQNTALDDDRKNE